MACQASAGAVAAILRGLPQQPLGRSIVSRIVSCLGHSGSWRKVWLIFSVLPSLGLQPDTSLATAVLRAAERCRASGYVAIILKMLGATGLQPDAACFRRGIAALCKGSWNLEAMRVCILGGMCLWHDHKRSLLCYQSDVGRFIKAMASIAGAAQLFVPPFLSAVAAVL
jgi:hypothetical protein